MIDPLKDTTALSAKVHAGFVPQRDAVGAFGGDFCQVARMIREADALLDEAGLSPAPSRWCGASALVRATSCHRLSRINGAPLSLVHVAGVNRRKLICRHG